MRAALGLAMLAIAFAMAALELIDTVESILGHTRKERTMTTPTPPVVTVDAKPLIQSLSAQGLALAALAVPIASLCDAVGIPIAVETLEMVLKGLGMAIALVGILRRSDISGMLRIRS